MSISATAPSLPEVDAYVDTLTALAERHVGGMPVRPQLVVGRPGVGRRVLLDRVAERATERGIKVFEPEFPAVSLDTPAHLLLQVAALAPDGAEAACLTHPGSRWEDRILAARTILEGVDRGLVLLRIPPGGTSPRPEQRQLEREISDVVALITRPSDAWMVVTTAPPGWRWPGTEIPDRHQLASASDGARFLSNEAVWGSLSEHARRIKETIGEQRASRCQPLQLRLAVALAAGGASLNRIDAAMLPGESLRSLEPLLHELFAARPRLVHALQRVACARIPVVREVLLDIASAGPDEEILVRCFLYPACDGRLRFHDQLRWVVAGDPRRDLRHTHQILFEHYRSLDGASDPRLGLQRVLPWVEKFHHAALADSAGSLDAWLAFRPPTREQYWEYGWSLSYVHGRFADAARVFETVLETLDAEDNYARHYFAFNLDKAGLRRREAEESFAKAVDGDPTNAWWNARYVTFLTERGRPDAALRAWRSALENVDPDGDLSGGDWLPWHLHLHVARTALNSGHIDLAERAIDAVGEPACQDARFHALAERLRFVRETRRLREALFPADIAVSDWWKPRLLRGREGVSNVRFGRVVESDAERVVLALATDRSSVTYHELSKSRWAQIAGAAEPVEGAFVEVATGSDGTDLLALEAPDASPPSESEVQYILRYLARSSWSRR